MKPKSIEDAVSTLHDRATAHAQALIDNTDTRKTQDALDEACLYYVEMTFGPPDLSPEVIMWGGKPMREGRCPPGQTCLACDRLGKHLEPAS